MNNQTRVWITVLFVFLGSIASIFIAYGVYVYGIFDWDFYGRYVFDWQILRFGFLTLIFSYLLAHLLYVNKSFWDVNIDSEDLWIDSGLYSFFACQIILLLTYPWDTIERPGELRILILYFLLIVVVSVGIYNFVKQIDQEKVERDIKDDLDIFSPSHSRRCRECGKKVKIDEIFCKDCGGPTM